MNHPTFSDMNHPGRPPFPLLQPNVAVSRGSTGQLDLPVSDPSSDPTVQCGDSGVAREIPFIHGTALEAVWPLFLGRKPHLDCSGRGPYLTACSPYFLNKMLTKQLTVWPFIVAPAVWTEKTSHMGFQVMQGKMQRVVVW